MAAHSKLDRETFQQLLASAFAVQESQINRQSLSGILEIDRLFAKGELDVDGAMHRMVELARGIANASGVAIGLLRNGELVYRAGSGSSVASVGRQVTASLTVSPNTKAGREILRVEDAQTDTRIEAAICRQLGARSLLILPIYRAQALAGVLEILFSEAHAFQECEVRTYRLMVRRIEAAMFREGQPAQTQKNKQSAEGSLSRRAVVQITHLRDRALGHLSSVPDPSSHRPIHAYVIATLSTVRELKVFKKPAFLMVKALRWARDGMWLADRRNLAMAALAAAVVLISWIGFSPHRRNASTESSAVATSTALEQQTTSQTAKRIPAQAMSVIRPITRKRARSRMRRFRTGHDEIEYIGDDVTVRYFMQASVPHRPPNAGGRVTYIGDDVTVRYFQPQPAPPAGR